MLKQLLLTLLLEIVSSPSTIGNSYRVGTPQHPWFPCRELGSMASRTRLFKVRPTGRPRALCALHPMLSSPTRRPLTRVICVPAPPSARDQELKELQRETTLAKQIQLTPDESNIYVWTALVQVRMCGLSTPPPHPTRPPFRSPLTKFQVSPRFMPCFR